LARLGETLDLEETARQSGALTRHRGVRSARDLLRIVLGYSVWDWSLRLLGVWCVLLGLSRISKTALRQHLRQCRRWLGVLIGFLLKQHQLQFPATGPLRVKVIDASVICQPGSPGTDWRVHLGFDLNRACLDQIELTDGHGGESLARFTVAPGELCLADCGDAVRSSVGPVLAAGAWLLLRVGWLKLPFEDAQAHAFDLIGGLKQAGLTPGSPAQEVAVWVQTPQGHFPLRLVAQAIPAEAAEEARRRLYKDAHKHGRTADARSLFAAGFVLLATNLPATPWGRLKSCSCIASAGKWNSPSSVSKTSSSWSTCAPATRSWPKSISCPSSWQRSWWTTSNLRSRRAAPKSLRPRRAP
jgi:hypothetical protein